MTPGLVPRVRGQVVLTVRPSAFPYNTGMQADRDLLQRARSGDSRAVDELLARHERQVFRFGLRMCGNEEDARDVLQETLLAAFKIVARITP